MKVQAALEDEKGCEQTDMSLGDENMGRNMGVGLLVGMIRASERPSSRIAASSSCSLAPSLPCSLPSRSLPLEALFQFQHL